MSKPALIALGVSFAIGLSLSAQNAAIVINVDGKVNRHPINPFIYGLAFASNADLTALNVPLNRAGGNAETRYNWQANGTNHASDYFYESIGENSATAGEHADTFINDSKTAGAQSMITIPIMGWVAKLGPNRGKLASFSVAKYGTQQYTDYWMPDAGNGVLANGTPISNDDPTDANMAVDASFQLGWIQHLVSTWGTAANGGLRYYILDNEHSIWQGTHRDVHPHGASMEEILGKMIAHAQVVKTVDPTALVVGPEEWGWTGYLYSGADQEYGAAHGWSTFPDKMAHGNLDYLPWLLDQFHYYEITHNQRLLDVFTVHFYPQSGEFGDDTSATMQAIRNRSTRSLWDPNYTDESWISDKVQLIPRLRNWMNAYYPGLKIGLTEYNWGAEGHINGATTQADIFGIFGRENLDLATRWTTPASTTPTYKAIQMYRNYDGNKSTFGDVSVSATAPNPDEVSAFAAVRSSDQALTIMLVAKSLNGTTPTTVNFANYARSGNIKQYQLTASNTITHLADITTAGTSVALSLPAQSITLLVVPGTNDVVAPTITLAGNPQASGGTYTFSGTASDNVAVSSVTWSATGATVASGTATGTTSWSAPIHLNSGTSTVTFISWDAAGNSASTSMGIAVTVSAPVRRRASRPPAH